MAQSPCLANAHLVYPGADPFIAIQKYRFNLPVIVSTMPNSDPLATLRDIQLPPPVSAWPPAPGWWLLAALLLGVLIALAWQAYRYYRRTAANRAALRELRGLHNRYASDADARRLAADLSQLLKRLALVKYPPPQVAPLYGEAWLTFLDRSGATLGFSKGVGRLLVVLPYQASVRETQPHQLYALLQLAQHWIKRQ